MPSKEVLDDLQALRDELQKLVPAIKMVQLAEQVVSEIAEVPRRVEELMNRIESSDGSFKRDLKIAFDGNLKEVTVQVDALILTAEGTVNELRNEIQHLAALKTSIEQLHKTIAEVDFPKRLDKLDANVAGIVAGMQSLQTRLDNLERNLTDRIVAVGDRQKEIAEQQKATDEELKTAMRGLLQSYEAASQKQKSYMLITWVLVGVGIVVSIALRLV